MLLHLAQRVKNVADLARAARIDRLHGVTLGELLGEARHAPERDADASRQDKREAEEDRKDEPKSDQVALGRALGRASRIGAGGFTSR